MVLKLELINYVLNYVLKLILRYHETFMRLKMRNLGYNLSDSALLPLKYGI